MCENLWRRGGVQTPPQARSTPRQTQEAPQAFQQRRACAYLHRGALEALGWASPSPPRSHFMHHRSGQPRRPPARHESPATPPPRCPPKPVMGESDCLAPGTLWFDAARCDENCEALRLPGVGCALPAADQLPLLGRLAVRPRRRLAPAPQEPAVPLMERESAGSCQQPAFKFGWPLAAARGPRRRPRQAKSGGVREGGRSRPQRRAEAATLRRSLTRRWPAGRPTAPLRCA